MARDQMTERSPAAVPRALLGGLFHSVLDWFYPRHCYHCGRPLHEGRSRMLCGDCSGELSARRIVGEVCQQCGFPFAGPVAPGTLCTTCRAERRHFDRARAFFTYAGPAVSIIQHFKFDGSFFLGPRLLAGVLDRGWMPTDMDGAEAVVPVPLHPRRRRERGYDQALLLSRVLAERLGCRLLGGVLVRTRYTSQQALLPVERRWDNVRGAFAVRKPARVRGRRLLLMDDVMTTGVTADECARALKGAGAGHVQVLTLARTAP